MNRRVFDDNYDDMLDMPHHVSKVHPQMTMQQRAAQFSPFAALSGHGEAVQEAQRLTDDKLDLDERQKIELDEKLQILLQHLKEQPKLHIVYFIPDDKKAGGEYVSKEGKIRKFDPYEKTLIMADGTRIAIDQISELKGELFDNLDYNF